MADVIEISVGPQITVHARAAQEEGRRKNKLSEWCVKEGKDELGNLLYKSILDKKAYQNPLGHTISAPPRVHYYSLQSHTLVPICEHKQQSIFG